MMVKEKFTDDIAGYVAKKATNLMDGMYPAMVREWTVTKLEGMFGKDYFVGGGIGFGYKTEPITDTPTNLDKAPPRRRVPDPQTAPLVTTAFNVFLSTRCVTDVLDYLHGATGRRWSYKQGIDLLTARRSIGEARWRDLVRPAMDFQALL